MTAPANMDLIPKGFFLSLTDSAAVQIGNTREQHELPEEAGLRVGVTEGGCSGLNYDVRVVDGPDDGDITYVLSGVNVFVNPADAKYISGMKIDWVSSMQESKFVFENPNETGGCGCGVSFTVE